MEDRPENGCSCAYLTILSQTNSLSLSHVQMVRTESQIIIGGACQSWKVETENW